MIRLSLRKLACLIVMCLVAIAPSAQITITTPKGMDNPQTGQKKQNTANDAGKKETPNPKSNDNERQQQPQPQQHNSNTAEQNNGNANQQQTTQADAQKQNNTQAQSGTQQEQKQASGNSNANKKRKSESANSDFSTSNNSKTPQSKQTINGRAGGYRVLAYISNNTRKAKAQANRRARDIALRFPQYRAYFTYKAPTWRLRIGDFDDEDDAKRALRQLRAAFPQYAKEMTVIHDNINIWK